MADSAVKISYALFENFNLMFNVTINYHTEYLTENLENAVLDKLLAGEVDISAYPLMLSKEKVVILDFPALSVPGTSKFIFRQPKLTYMTNVYTLPFDTHVWYSSLALLILLTCILYAVTKWEWYKVDRKDAALLEIMYDTEIADSFLDVLFVTMGAITQQGSEKSSTTLQGRIVLFFLFISLMFLFTAYSANIVALLQASSTNIGSLKDLMESPLEIGVHDTATYRQLMTQLNGGEHDKGTPTWNFVNSSFGIDRVRNNLYAFHVETSIGYSMIENTFHEGEKCGLQEMQLLQVRTDLYFPIRKGSPFTEMFRSGFLRLKEIGVTNREIGLIYAKKPECKWSTDADSTFVSIGFIDCYFAMVILGSGVAIAIVILLLEMIVLYVKTNLI